MLGNDIAGRSGVFGRPNVEVREGPRGEEGLPGVGGKRGFDQARNERVFYDAARIIKEKG